jgi:hypothetical protein
MKGKAFEVDKAALKRALIGVTNLRTEALILMGALPDEDLPEIIRIVRRMVGFEDAELH